jgi:DNA-binding NarL/FixJ family response regulator
MTSLRVLLIEDHPVMVQVICTLLSLNCTVVDTRDRAEDILHALHALQPDVLVLDISLPGRSGLQVLPEVRSEFPLLGIVITTSHVELIYQTESMRRGADGFVNKDRLKTELWPAVQNANLARSRYRAAPEA